jgi:hypothetical protein
MLHSCCGVEAVSWLGIVARNAYWRIVGNSEASNQKWVLEILAVLIAQLASY